MTKPGLSHDLVKIQREPKVDFCPRDVRASRIHGRGSKVSAEHGRMPSTPSFPDLQPFFIERNYIMSPSLPTETSKKFRLTILQRLAVLGAIGLVLALVLNYFR